MPVQVGTKTIKCGFKLTPIPPTGEESREFHRNLAARIFIKLREEMPSSLASRYAIESATEFCKAYSEFSGLSQADIQEEPVIPVAPCAPPSEGLTGTFDNMSTMRRETYLHGRLVDVRKRESYSPGWGCFPDFPVGGPEPKS